MRKSPFVTFPAKAFWSKSVSSGWSARKLVSDSAPLLRGGDKIMSAGSCFAANIIPHLERAGFEYVRSEWLTMLRGFSFRAAPENFNYDTYTAAYGNIYTARQLLQTLRRSRGLFKPKECVWEEEDKFTDPFRPGLRYFSRSMLEFEMLTRQHLNCIVDGFRRATVFIFTLGLTEAWVSRADGAVYPSCPGTIAGAFDDAKHKWINLSVDETRSDLNAFIREVRAINKNLRIIITVSPVPLVATASRRHVLEATTYSKSVLRVAAAQVAEQNADVIYFPAYEIITGPQAPADFFESDRRQVSQSGVLAVMDALMSASECNRSDFNKGLRADSVSLENENFDRLASKIIERECEEAIVDQFRSD